MDKSGKGSVDAICKGCNMIKSAFTMPHFKVLLGTSVLFATTELDGGFLDGPRGTRWRSLCCPISAKRRATSCGSGQDERRRSREITASAKWHESRHERRPTRCPRSAGRQAARREGLSRADGDGKWDHFVE